MVVKKVSHLSILFAVMLFLLCASTASSNDEKKLLQKARKSLSNADYNQAKNYYNQLLQVNTTNPDYFFEAGIAYYNSEVEREKALGYFQNALKVSGNDTIAEIYYYLGRSFQYVNEFTKAIEAYNQFKRFLTDDKNGLVLQRDVNRYIEMCNNGIQLLGTQNNKFDIKNLGTHINSQYSEYASVVNKAESLIIYTARRNVNVGKKYYHDSKKFEDIYVSHKENGEWTNATKFDSSGVYISSKINSKFHDAAISFNEKEDKLFIYRQNDIWQSELVNGVWTDPVRMNSNINTKKGHEPSVFITPDEQTLLFVTNKEKGGQGALDIWMSKKEPDGTWGVATNLGPTINTMFDEDAPYLTKDGKTLYFSSRGHNTVGGYDIFKSILNADGTWGAPVNIGLPINSAGDDIYYTISEDETYGYFSSSRPYGYGFMDIYRVQLECKSIPNTEVRGFIVATEKLIPAGATITVKEKESGQTYGPFYSDKKTGKYLMVLPPEKTYELELVVDNFQGVRPHREEFTIPKQCEYYQLYQEIRISRFKDTTDNKNKQMAEFKNAFFDIKDSARKKYDIDILKSDSIVSPEVSPELTFTPVMISGNIKHNDIQKAKKVEIFLVDKNKQIIKATVTDDKGNFSFTQLNPDEKYAVLIKEDDVKMSYFGDSKNNFNSEVVVAGNLDKLTPPDNKIDPVKNMDVLLITNDKKMVNSTATDEKGNFKMTTIPGHPDSLNPLYANSNFPYKIDPTDIDMVYSAYISTLKPGTDQPAYTEYIDIIDLLETKPELISFENIYFDFDKYFLRDKSKTVMDKIAGYMVAHPETTVEIDGHCDWMGSDEYNIGLSENRAISAYTYLLAKGVEAKNMKKYWYGERRPAAPNANADGTDNPEGRQLNRRVEFKVNIPDTAEITLRF